MHGVTIQTMETYEVRITTNIEAESLKKAKAFAEVNLSVIDHDGELYDSDARVIEANELAHEIVPMIGYLRGQYKIAKDIKQYSVYGTQEAMEEEKARRIARLDAAIWALEKLQLGDVNNG